MENNYNLETFEWCGYNWKSEMDGGRIIHPENPWYWMSMDQIAIVGDNCIELTMRYNPKEVKYWNGKTYYPKYECGTMRSIEKFGFGTFSCVIQVPKGRNFSSSFWLTGDGNWPPEIDIMEGWPRWFGIFESRIPFINPGWKTTTNIHYRNEQMKHEHMTSRNVSILKQRKNPANNMIKYECEWLPDKITFKANGKTTRKIVHDECRKLYKNIEHPENGYEMNVVFNVWAGNPDLKTPETNTPMIIKDFKYIPL